MDVTGTTDPTQPCYEQIPGGPASTHILVREAFWYAAAMIDAGWQFSSIDASGFAGTAPDNSVVTVKDSRDTSDALSKLLVRQLILLDYLADNLVPELAKLITWRGDFGPVSRPQLGSTISEDEVDTGLSSVTLLLRFKIAADQIKMGTQEHLRILRELPHGSGLADAIDKMLRVLRDPDIGKDPQNKELVDAMVTSVVGWACSYSPLAETPPAQATRPALQSR